MACYGIEDGDANAICLEDVAGWPRSSCCPPSGVAGRAMRELGCNPAIRYSTASSGS
ncbi:MAG: hypothetical protein ACLVKA_10715 [Collinsella aerofaciens]